MDEAPQGTPPVDAEAQTFELQLKLPARPLLPKKVTQLGLPETPSPLRVAVTPSETLNDLRATINDSPEGYWLGAFAFQRPKSDERVKEWAPLAEVFDGVPVEQRVLDVVHVPYTDTGVRMHLQRLRDLLTGGQADPSALSIDAGASVHDAVVRPEEWTDAAVPPADQWSGWPAASTELLFPSVCRSVRALPRCLRSLSLSAWNPPPQPLVLQGHILYLVAETLEGEALHITASVHGFFVNRSASSRFDPQPSEEKAHLASASLFDVLCAASPLFLRNFAKLFNDPVSTRDYFSALPVMNAMPAAPWLARLPRHDADLLRSQTAFLLTGAMSSDTLDAARDWNEELQSSRELPRATLAERLMRDRVLNRLYAELGLAAARAVPRVAAGEVVPMNPADAPEAHMFLFNNLFVSKGVDGVHIYPYIGGDEAAHVAVSKDAQGVRLLAGLDPEGVYLLGTVVVDWLGERWVVQTIVPGLFRSNEAARDAAADAADAGEERDAAADAATAAAASVAYGGVEGPDTIHTDPAFAEVLRPAAERLHLAEHAVRDAQGQEHTLCVSVDCKGLRGADGRKYLLDVSRTCPVDVAFLEQDAAGMVLEGDDAPAYPHRLTLLRPELLELYYDHALREFARGKLAKKDPNEETPARIDVADFRLAFNPDAFVEYSVAGQVTVPVRDEADASVKAVRDAGVYLRETAIPRFVSDVAAGLVSIADGFALSQQLHARGINLRYLGHVAHLCQASQRDKLDERIVAKLGPGHEAILASVRRVAVEEMVVRAAKHALRRRLRGALPTAVAPCIAHFLNCLLGTAVEPNPAPVVPPAPFGERGTSDWASLTPAALADELRATVRARFRFELAPDALEQLHKPQVLRALCLRVGVQLRVLDYAFEKRAPAPAPPKKLTAKEKKAQAQALPPRSTTFVPDDVLNVVPLVKNSTPKSALVEEAFEAGRLAFARGDRELGTELLLEGIGFHEQVYGLVHPETARCYALFASLAHHFATEVAREKAKQEAKEAEAKEAEAKEAKEGEAKEGEAKEGEAKEGEAKDAQPGEHQEGSSLLADLPAIVEETVTIDNALRFQRQAVTISERTLGLDHPDTMMQYMNLAVIERTAGNFDEALRYQHRVLVLWQLLYGENHPDAVHTLSSIALLLQAKRDFRTSLKVYQAAHDLAQGLFGPDSIYTGNMAHELSQAYTLSGDLKNAIHVEKDAWRIFHERLGDEDALTKESQAFLTSLTSSAVRVARFEQAGRTHGVVRGAPRGRPARGTGRGLPRTAGRGARLARS